jgi:hypothetical protein
LELAELGEVGCIGEETVGVRREDAAEAILSNNSCRTIFRGNLSRK